MWKCVNRIVVLCIFLSATVSAYADEAREQFRLLALDLEEPSLAVKVLSSGTSATELKVGDKVVFEITGVGSDTLYIFNMDSTGGLTLLFPNQFESQLRNPPAVVRIPSKGTKYVFEAFGEPGTETVKFFVLSGDVTEFETLLKRNFAMGEVFPRGIVPVPTTLGSLSSYLSNPKGVQVRTAKVDYKIIH